MSKKESQLTRAVCARRRKTSTLQGQLSTAMRRSLTLIGVLLLSSCSLTGTQESSSPAGSSAPLPFDQPAAVSPVDRSIVTDFVGITRQIFTPFNTTLQFPQNTQDPLLEHFMLEFADAGYGIQRVSADQGSNFFNYTRFEEEDDNGDPLVSFSSTIGAVLIARDYTIPRSNTISPASPVKLSGTRVPVKVADAPSGRFVISDPDFSSATYIASLNLTEQAPPVITLITDDVVSGVADQSSGGAGRAGGASFQAFNSSRLEISNLFYGGQSNFSSILDDYQQVERRVIVFGNDSMVLGDTNKQLIEQFVQQQLSGEDLISLVGCSNGPTVLEIGNEGLALGRAERVTEALLSQGVSRERILDEGCWAPVSAGDKFPSRGVVMELWRKNA